jgi:two-component system, LytTR family, sensor kinase
VQRAFLILGFWTAYGVYAAWQTHFRSSFTKDPYPWASALTAELSYAYLWALFTPVIGRICDRWRAEINQWRSTLLVHILASVVFASAAKLLWDAIMVVLLDMRIGYYVNGFTIKRLAWSLNGALDIGFTAYFLVAASWYVGDYYVRYLQKQREADVLERELARAELRALKMQLNPHFLFNTLHAISALVAASPKEAEMMIARLSDMLRSSLDSSGQQEVTLEQELRFLQLYLDIEQMRFRDRLQVRIQLDADAAGAMVPNMLLQPLVENSIRHGIERVSRKGRIDIQARLDGEQLILSVADNGAGLPADRSGVDGFGVGLRATRGRLERLYGSRFSLVLRARAEGGVEAVVVLPYQPAPSREENVEEQAGAAAV